MLHFPTGFQGFCRNRAILLAQDCILTGLRFRGQRETFVSLVFLEGSPGGGVPQGGAEADAEGEQKPKNRPKHIEILEFRAGNGPFESSRRPELIFEVRTQRSASLRPENQKTIFNINLTR